jgi:hypothetical protein
MVTTPHLTGNQVRPPPRQSHSVKVSSQWLCSLTEEELLSYQYEQSGQPCLARNRYSQLTSPKIIFLFRLLDVEHDSI